MFWQQLDKEEEAYRARSQRYRARSQRQRGEERIGFDVGHTPRVRNRRLDTIFPPECPCLPSHHSVVVARKVLCLAVVVKVARSTSHERCEAVPNYC